MEDRSCAVSRVRRPRLPGGDRLVRRRPRPRDVEVGSAAGERVDRESELGDDPEVAAAPALQRPQQVRVGCRVDRLERTVGGHDLRADEVVCGQAELSPRESKAATERHAGDAHRRARPGRECGPGPGERGGDIDQLCAGADRGGARAGVDRDRVELSQVEDDPARQRRVTGVTVTTGSRPHRDAMRHREADRVSHVDGVDGAGDRGRKHAVEARVVQLSDGRKAGRAALIHLPADRLLQRPRRRL